MIALKRVKTLPATMLEVEREEVSGGGPSLRRRAAASLLERPLLACWDGRYPFGPYSIGFGRDGR